MICFGEETWVDAGESDDHGCVTDSDVSVKKNNIQSSGLTSAPIHLGDLGQIFFIVCKMRRLDSIILPSPSQFQEPMISKEKKLILLCI